MQIITGKLKLIGLVSDTHGLLRPNSVRFLKNCDTIIHAGDVGNINILQKLNNLAPVIAVRGNTDVEDCFDGIPNSRMIKLHGTSLYVIHDIKKINPSITTTKVEIIVSGHTHKPEITKKLGVMYVNPGSAGPYRTGCPITLALLYIRNGIIDSKIINLDSA